jgi:hypothetical protein
MVEIDKHNIQKVLKGCCSYPNGKMVLGGLCDQRPSISYYERRTFDPVLKIKVILLMILV